MCNARTSAADELVQKSRRNFLKFVKEQVGKGKDELLASALSVLLLSAMFRFPWGIMFLFGGGFALAEASKRSGLSDWVGGELRYIFIQL